tara:strand:+ start:1214 stop:2632 length:1419 start_codon:yes stop_codon:yes gene_type:complete
MRQQLKKPLLVSLLGGVACFAASALAAQSVQIIDFSKPDNQQKITLKQGGTYRLTGESTQGQLWIEAGEEKITLILDNLTLSNTMGSAIFIASSGDANVILANGSQNFLADHPRQSGSIGGEQNAPLYAKSDLKIEGQANATLTVNGRYKDGIVSKDDLDIRGGTIIVEAVDDALYGKDSVDIRNAAVNIVAGDDGIKADNVKRTDKGFVYIENSQVTLHVQDDAIKGALAVDLLTSNINIEHSKEGIESNSITIYSGDVSVVSLDDALNIVKGDFSSARLLDGLSEALSSENETSRKRTPGTLTVLGGNIHIRSGGDGFDSNGAARMSGGRLFIEGPNSRGDGYIDVDEGFTLTGGELLAIGNSSMAQTPSDTTQPILQVNTEETVAAGTVLTIVEANGKSVLALTLPKAITSLTFSAPALTIGNTYQIMAGDVMLGEVALTEMITVIGERGRGGRGKGKGRDKNKSWWEW